MVIDRLRDVTLSLLDMTRLAFSLRNEVLEMKSIFENAGGLCTQPDENIASGETITSGGVAISPTMAMMCLDDFARTVQFIRGSHAAIADHREKNGDRPVRVLYAGCGPWAPLAIPLMTVFGTDDVQFGLLDIHEPSVRSVERIINALGLTNYVEDLATGDACSYRIDPSRQPDVIVIEMLRAALESEPQVAVAMNLLGQAPESVMIPEEVRIDLALVDGSREFSFENEIPNRERIHLGTVIKLDQETIKSDTLFSPVVIQLPEFDELRYRPMLLSTVKVYGEIQLMDYDSGITCPKYITVDRELRSGDRLEFVYEGGSHPRIVARVS